MQVFRSMIIDAPIDKVWAAIRLFDGVAAWNPGVKTARMETGTATTAGSIRHLDIADGSVFRETLLAHSDAEHSYTYDILQSPLPVRRYTSTHRLIAVTHTDQTLSCWESGFECDAAQAAAMECVVGDGIYINAMAGLAAYLKENCDA
ncbi:MAG: SRPBCC family protein [Paracoccaceae bacterium]